MSKGVSCLDTPSFYTEFTVILHKYKCRALLKKQKLQKKSNFLKIFA